MRYDTHAHFGVIHNNNKKEIVTVDGTSGVFRPVWNTMERIIRENKWNCIVTELTCWACDGYGGNREEKSGGHMEMSDCDECYGTGLVPKYLATFEKPFINHDFIEENRTRWPEPTAFSHEGFSVEFEGLAWFTYVNGKIIRSH